MVAHVLERLAPQVDEILVNANRNPEAYAAFGHRVVADEIPGFAGPLAGFERGLAHARGELVATVPCDSPFLPPDLVPRLRAALESAGADLAVAKTGAQAHPVFCLMRRAVHASLERFLASGQRKIDRWYAALAVVEVAFDDEAQAFANINTRDELADLEKPT
jgi:molybdopterin-guanine dinucleotide biosynthesis protein A